LADMLVAKNKRTLSSGSVSLYQEGEKMFVQRVNRARQLLGMGLSEQEVIRMMVESGETPQDAIFTVKAAIILQRHEESDIGRADTLDE